jgi:protein-tyrosine kinase
MPTAARLEPLSNRPRPRRASLPAVRPSAHVCAYYEPILARIRAAQSRHGQSLRSVGITSCRNGQGVSITAACLAGVAATQEAGEVLLVDCHFARPAAHSHFAMEPGPGLLECLAENYPLAEAIRPAAANLSILTAGQLRGSPARAYASPALPALLRTLAERYPLVVYDLPPATQASCLAGVTGLLDGVLLVIEAGCVPGDVGGRAAEVLAAADARILGVVLNKGW